MILGVEQLAMSQTLTFAEFISLNTLTTGVDRLRLSGLGGDDRFDVPGNHPFTSGVLVEGGSPSASDVLNFTGSGGDVVVDMSLGTVTEIGFSRCLIRAAWRLLT